MSEFKPNANQQEAIYYDNKEPLIIEAGPGSGKTRVLTERVKFLLNDKKVDPESLLVITFTRKATDELKKRLSEDISSDIINKMQISTIHSFCYELLKKNDNFAYEVLDDDNNQKKTLFIQKNKQKLGFKDYYTIFNGSLSHVINKYGEYSTFNVDSNGLVNYISENRPLSEEYKKLVDESENFPYDDINKSDDLKNSWYNGRYYQIAKSYPTYLELLDKNYLIDYDTLQIKALDYLENNSETQYKNVLIDEFQDVNPVQYFIFEKLLENADSFTVVGDVDQSIYGFRGALFDYFNDLEEDYNGHKISLDVNYRSSENVVTLTEEFIRPHRDPKSKKNMTHSRGYNNNCYYMISEGEKGQEAENILDYIKKIKELGKIEKYSDVAILLRSLQGSMIKDLIDLLDLEEIPYDVRNFSKLLDNDDVKSLALLLYYVAPLDEKSPIFSKMEREWLNLKGFTGDKFEPTLWKLSEETCDLLRQIQDDFEQKAVVVAKEVYEEEFGSKTKISKFSGLFGKNKFTENKTDEMMKTIFNKVPRPHLDLNLIKNSEDREFFQKLEDLKLRIHANVSLKITTHLEKIKNNYKKEYDSEFNSRRLDFVIDLANKNRYYVENGVVEKLDAFKRLVNEGKLTNKEAISIIDEIIAMVKGYDDNLTILDIFYELLNMTDFFNNPSERSLNNFADISESIYNYEAVMDKDDLVGYFRFLQNNARDWDEKALSDSEGVQIMTIHKSKGLEFPVVIVPAISEGKFPKDYEDPSQKDFIFPNYTYFTPNEFLKYKQNLKHNDEYYHDLEEKRILYVAMTRAQDSLLLSFVDKIHPLFENCVNGKFVKPLDYSTFDKCEAEYRVNDDDILNTSYTSFKLYEDCPFKYQLINELNFYVSDSNEIRAGSFIHKVFNKINADKIENPQLSNEKIDKIIEDIYISTSNLSKDDDKFNEFKDNVYQFYEKMGDAKILESEYGFNIMDKDYNIVGSIDVIYEKDGEIGIIDYKNTELRGNDIERYKNQLKIYLHALRFDAKYKDKNITKAGIYGVKTDNLVIEDISNEEIDEYILEIEDNVKKIKNKEFEPRHSGFCNNCEFEFICN